MGGQQDSLTPSQVEWIRRQRLFFVATAPPNGRGKVNVSPKGIKGKDATTFTVSDDGLSCWYIDMTGSGVETIAHLRETSRITIMFIEIEEGAPLILRLFGTATVHEPTSPSFTKYIPSPADRVPGTRAVVSVDINLVTTACGWNVPIYNYVKPREKLVEWSQKMEEADEAGTPLDMKIHKYPGMDYYRKLKNSRSLDGLKGLDAVSDASSTLSRIAEWVGYKWRIGGGREATVGFAVGVGLTVGVAIGGRNFRKW